MCSQLIFYHLCRGMGSGITGCKLISVKLSCSRGGQREERRICHDSLREATNKSSALKTKRLVQPIQSSYLFCMKLFNRLPVSLVQISFSQRVTLKCCLHFQGSRWIICPCRLQHRVSHQIVVSSISSFRFTTQRIQYIYMWLHL